MTTKCGLDLTSRQMENILTEILFYLRNGATISAINPNRVLEPQHDGSVFGGLQFDYTTRNIK